MRKDIKIVIVGDEGVGKTTIISSFVSNSFAEHVQKVVPEVTIPAEVLNAPCATRIIDTCNSDDIQQQGRTQLNIELKQCDAVIIAYASNQFNTFMSVRTKWMPLIKQLRSSNPIPIVIVGTKSEMEEDQDKYKDQIEETIQMMSNDYGETIRWMQCSSKLMFNIHEVLETTQSLVLYPERILFDRPNGRLTDKCEKVLRRIFKLCDLDNDGSLSDQEINYFQQRCQHVTMSTEDIIDLKGFLRSRIDNGVDDNGFTIEGFLFMNLLFLMKNPQHTWVSIRSFKYDDNLELSQDYLSPLISVPKGNYLELSNDGIVYLKSLFKRFDSNNDGLLSKSDQQKLYSTTPGCPFTDESYEKVGINKSTGDLTLNSFLSLWSLQTFEEYQLTLNYFAYFGYDSILKPNTTCLLQQTTTSDRTTYNCFVFGQKSSGKSTLLQNFIKQSTYSSDDTKDLIVCSLPIDTEKFIILNEFNNPQVVLESNKLTRCDGICLVYDNSIGGSLDYAVNIYNQVIKSFSKIPVVFVHVSKTEDPNNSNNSDSAILKKLNVVPLTFSMTKNNLIYRQIFDSIERNNHSTNNSKTNNNNNNKAITKQSNVWITLGAVGAILGAAGFFILKQLNKAATK
ncbi:mitochondrial GTPase [Cavenderia fasciculata]|uniref:Mitochondrial Rho GTPase n=1 Tax=Cavenderia fasciculata TaxID=261658 RepID=F4PHB7_CACFS|nr:mitochondrial GTPase [Cavenderia fasciculata]EGG25101.1 mitochondrial GTPase [Cavenderia fasciculata]|eukprot:XP_004362952.1 mitochondrial GTPase [Cavenderia fasciculata]